MITLNVTKASGYQEPDTTLDKKKLSISSQVDLHHLLRVSPELLHAAQKRSQGDRHRRDRHGLSSQVASLGFSEFGEVWRLEAPL